MKCIHKDKDSASCQKCLQLFTKHFPKEARKYLQMAYFLPEPADIQMSEDLFEYNGQQRTICYPGVATWDLRSKHALLHFLNANSIKSTNNNNDQEIMLRDNRTTYSPSGSSLTIHYSDIDQVLGGEYEAIGENWAYYNPLNKKVCSNKGKIFHFSDVLGGLLVHQIYNAHGDLGHRELYRKIFSLKKITREKIVNGMFKEFVTMNEKCEEEFFQVASNKLGKRDVDHEYREFVLEYWDQCFLKKLRACIVSVPNFRSTLLFCHDLLYYVNHESEEQFPYKMKLQCTQAQEQLNFEIEYVHQPQQTNMSTEKHNEIEVMFTCEHLHFSFISLRPLIEQSVHSSLNSVLNNITLSNRCWTDGETERYKYSLPPL